MTDATSRRVLDVGQCDPDHANITRMLKEHFDVSVDRAKSIEQVHYMMGFYEYDLVLINRILDADGAQGLELIEQLKTNAETQEVPVMLVSNFADAQDAAVDLGALPGFGKSQLSTDEALDRLNAALSA
jgi:DNA-binding response OmpR family regulator